MSLIEKIKLAIFGPPPPPPPGVPQHNTWLVLSRVREILSDPKAWTKGDLAKRADGYSAAPSDPKATCWCIYGALSKAGEELFPGRIVPKFTAETTIARSLPERFKRRIARFNDHKETTHEDVLNILDHSLLGINYDYARKPSRPVPQT